MTQNFGLKEEKYLSITNNCSYLNGHLRLYPKEVNPQSPATKAKFQRKNVLALLWFLSFCTWGCFFVFAWSEPGELMVLAVAHGGCRVTGWRSWLWLRYVVSFVSLLAFFRLHTHACKNTILLTTQTVWTTDAASESEKWHQGPAFFSSLNRGRLLWDKNIQL